MLRSPLIPTPLDCQLDTRYDGMTDRVFFEDVLSAMALHSLICLEFGSDMVLVSRLGQLWQGESIASTATGLHESGHA